MQIPQFVKKLEAEISRVEKVEERLAQQARLQEILRVYSGEDSIISFSEIAERLKAQGEETFYKTGFSGFDGIIRGFYPQQLVVVSALTKSGKTSWCMDLTTRLAELNPVWFPFEESAEELIRKFLERGEEPPKAFAPAFMKGGGTQWIEERVVESIAKFGTRMVVIDQLDFVVPMNEDNHALRVGQAVRELKQIAKRWNVLIFLICHLVKTRMDTQPTLEDLKGSSSIAQEADTVILLWREMSRVAGQVEITDNVNVSVQANRKHGKTGNVKMRYVNGHFTEDNNWLTNAEHNSRTENEYQNF